MQSGFLGIQTSPEFPDNVKIITWDELPQNKNNNYGEGIQYITKFNDILAAGMHVHNGLRHKLLDADTHLYQADIAEAIAVVESDDDLRQQRIWIDPALNDDDFKLIEALVKQKRLRKKRINRLIQIAGFLALALLALNFIGSIS